MADDAGEWTVASLGAFFATHPAGPESSATAALSAEASSPSSVRWSSRDSMNCGPYASTCASTWRRSAGTVSATDRVSFGFGATLPRCSQKSGAEPRVCTNAEVRTSAPAPICTSCSVSTVLAHAPSSLIPRAFVRVPACSAERRETRLTATASAPICTRSVRMAPWIRGVSHGALGWVGSAEARGASAVRFHTKRLSACAYPRSAPAPPFAAASARRCVRCVSGTLGEK